MIAHEDELVGPIEWSGESIQLSDSISMSVSRNDSTKRRDVIRMIARQYDRFTDADFYAYSLELDNGDRWYVGETANLYDRISTHLRDKTVSNIHRIEQLATKEDAKERERELSYELAIEKGTTEVYGGR